MKTFFALSLLLASLSINAAEERLPDISGVTDRGRTIEIYSELSPIVINQMHSWRMRVLDADGTRPELEEMLVFGGMPEHDHGMPTQPVVTTYLENGDYLLEGVRFHMQGKWQLQIEVQIFGVGDTAIIDFEL
ncbi:MAG: auxin-binding protein [Pseudohongiella sp.]|nr:MAG: auxin-binding protein [Pseudohongiella sp.]